MRRAATCFFVLIATATPTFAQTTGSCDHGSATAELDVGNVRAKLFTTGGFFWNGGSPTYEVPKESGANSIFSIALWVGGYVNDEIRMSAATYSDWEFWPGPLDPQGNQPADCSIYDRLYRVSDADIRHYDTTGVATTDMLAWPADLGAPVFDGDGDPTNYELAGGDRPWVYGDQVAWWVMNDRGNTHRYTESHPLGLEIRVAAFAVDGPDDSWPANSTFYRFELVNRSGADMDSMYFGFHADADLGSATDDFIGSDSLLGLAFTYNADDFDEGSSGYSSRPPALGFDFLSGPLAEKDGRDNNYNGVVDEVGERLQLSSFVYRFKTNLLGQPRNPTEFYRQLSGRLLDGSPITEGGLGLTGAGRPTTLMLTGNPPAYWSEEDIDDQGTRNPPADRFFIAGSGPFTIAPDGRQEFLLAILWARGSDRLDSLRRLKQASGHAQRAIDSLLVFDTRASEEGLEPPATFMLRHYPNPATELAVIGFELTAASRARLALYDALGRRIRVITEGDFDARRHEVEHDFNSLPSGTYFYRLETPSFTATRPLTIVR